MSSVVNLPSTTPFRRKPGCGRCCKFCQAIHCCRCGGLRDEIIRRNVTEKLRPGGFFIGTTADASVLVRKLRAVEGLVFYNSLYKVVFEEKFKKKAFPKGEPYGIEYRFTLDESVEDCPEFIVHWPSFVALAKQYGLENIMAANFHDFYEMFAQEGSPELDLFKHMKAVDENGTISPEQWDAIYLYMAFSFRKVGNPSAGLDESTIRPLHPHPQLTEDNIVVMQAPPVPAPSSPSPVVPGPTSQDTPRRSNSASIRNIID
uniref:mRNA (guanine-N(7))-methyltransferase n=2 Tax=Compsopogon caeruleus TaxID=31354 RepID=A0A6T6CRL7_9RHOD|mmetsp:Transcript_8400/g.17084  ORF Transcript_8400/g.17084 Transcript_8400/m.17084 type:complete len:260 (+) Transcript_8400:539-1318(+)